MRHENSYLQNFLNKSKTTGSHFGFGTNSKFDKSNSYFLDFIKVSTNI